MYLVIAVWEDPLYTSSTSCETDEIKACCKATQEHQCKDEMGLINWRPAPVEILVVQGSEVVKHYDYKQIDAAWPKSEA